VLTEAAEELFAALLIARSARQAISDRRAYQRAFPRPNAHVVGHPPAPELLSGHG
jgi:hypothetical protein